MPKRSILLSTGRDGADGGSSAAAAHDGDEAAAMTSPVRRLRSSSGSPMGGSPSPLKTSPRKRPAPSGPLLHPAISPSSALMLAPAGGSSSGNSGRGRKRRAAEVATAAIPSISSSPAPGSGSSSNRRRRPPGAWRSGTASQQQEVRGHHTLKSDHLPRISLDSPDANQSKDGRVRLEWFLRRSGACRASMMAGFRTDYLPPHTNPPKHRSE